MAKTTKMKDAGKRRMACHAVKQAEQRLAASMTKLGALQEAHVGGTMPSGTWFDLLHDVLERLVALELTRSAAGWAQKERRRAAKAKAGA